MPENLLSVGLDVGTTTTQMIVSRLTVENRASGFAVPRMHIAEREILYQSPVHFTPLTDESHVDGAALRRLVDREYESAGIHREDVDTGAVIITGETSRKENARTAAENLADLAGDFVVTTAGPHLESILAAKGSGAAAFSRATDETVLHFDIGGGTSNWALIEAGKIVKTGCLNVGGRLVKFREDGRVYYVSPVLDGLTSLRVGDKLTREKGEAVAQILVQVLEMAAGLLEENVLLEKLVTQESRPLSEGAPKGRRGDVMQMRNDLPTPQSPAATAPLKGEPIIYSFSGGVADCIDREIPWEKYGDLGPLLGRAIRESRLCAGRYRLGEQTIRATVIGAGCHSTQLSGSTVYHRNIRFPVKNLTAVENPQMLRQLDTPGILSLELSHMPGYRELRELAEKIAAAVPEGSVYVAVNADVAKALGHLLELQLGEDRPILCLDGIGLRMGDYLDVGAPVGPALPVVVKTLIFGTPR